jgi:hypothetical protein
MQRAPWQSGKSLPKKRKEKKRGKKTKTARSKSAFPKTTKRFQTFQKETK